MRTLARLFKAHESGLIVAILAVLLGTVLLDSERVYWHEPLSSLHDVSRHASLLGIFALGSAIVIISGGIDLSAGSVIAFSGTICGALMLAMAPEQMQRAEPVGPAVIIVAVLGTLIVGFLIGSLHAWLISAVGLPPFVATLATLVGLRSLGRALAEKVTESFAGARSTQIQIFDPQFRSLATNVWIPVAIFAVLAVLAALLLSRTVVGRHLYALGGNEEAARLSGIRTDQLKWLAYCIGALCSSLAGVLYIADQSVADPQTLGRAYELNAIAAAVVGGCSLQGGVGTVFGVVLGCVFLRVVVDSIAKIINSGAEVYEGLIVGLLVVVAVAFNNWRAMIAARQRLFPGALGIVATVALVLLIGAVATIVFRLQVGVGAGLAALALLVGLQVLERRLTRTAR
ncbi:MAG: ABC transporter permease [Pirellulales bacterium]|nr:ABC transporter permease [Pirellulales bacterium]